MKITFRVGKQEGRNKNGKFEGLGTWHNDDGVVTLTALYDDGVRIKE